MERLIQARSTFTSPGMRTQLLQLAKVFKWCGEHEIELRVRDHLHKYREAAAYLNRILTSGDSEAMRRALDEIQAHTKRDDLREWVKRRMREGTD